MVPSDLNLKECPSCHTKVFDDMDRCYECMHAFEHAESADKTLSCAHAKIIAGHDSSPTRKKRAAEGNAELFGLFLIELSRFLGEFAADRIIGVQEPVGVIGEDAAMRAIADKEIDP